MRTRYVRMPGTSVIVTALVAVVAPREGSAQQVSATASTQPAGVTSSQPAPGLSRDAEQRQLGRVEMAEHLLRRNENAIRRALNADDYTAAAQRVSASRQILEIARDDLAAARHREWIESLDALGRVIDDGRARQAADLAAQRIAVVARQRRPQATTKPAEVAEVADGTTGGEPGGRSRPSGTIGVQEPVQHLGISDAPREGIREMPVVTYPDAQTWQAIARREGASEQAERANRGREVLAERRSVIDYPEGTDLAQALGSLRGVGGLSIDANWGVLERAGIDRRTPTQGMRLNNVRLDTVLQLLLDDVGNSAGVSLGYAMIDGIIWISTVEDLSTKTFVRVYDVSDLLLRVRSFRAPTDILNGGSGSGGGLFSGGVNTSGGMQNSLPTVGR